MLKRNCDQVRDVLRGVLDHGCPPQMHREIVGALHALARIERVARECPKCGELIPAWAETHEGCGATKITVGGVPLVEVDERRLTFYSFECGRCAWLHTHEGEEVPEHSPRCPMREERARAWDEGYDCAHADEQAFDMGEERPRKNPHR